MNERRVSTDSDMGEYGSRIPIARVSRFFSFVRGAPHQSNRSTSSRRSQAWHAIRQGDGSAVGKHIDGLENAIIVSCSHAAPSITATAFGWSATGGVHCLRGATDWRVLATPCRRTMAVCAEVRGARSLQLVGHA
jgi:hypothetical protein